MDRLSKILILSILGGIITLSVGTSYIPSSGGPVPLDKSPQEFSEQQQREIYNSNGFKVTMVGTGITVASMLILYLRSCMEDYRVVNIPFRRQTVRSILKVKRIHHQQVAPEPQPIEVIVDDPKPQVKTTPNLTAMVPAPSSSPPPQLIPRGPVIEIIPLPGGLRNTFKYPPPYDVLNR
jgi:hypothetical protein